MTQRKLIILGCSAQQPTRKRNQGGYLLLWHTEGLLFDPGEGTQRQFIFANVAPPMVNRIFISHFHGDHCLGLGSMLMRLNLDRVSHPIHCYYPASGKKYFDRLRFGTIYHEHIEVIEHPIETEGLVEEGPTFDIEAYFLTHGVDNLGWRIKEKQKRKFDKKKLDLYGVKGPLVKKLEGEGTICIENKIVSLDDVSTLCTPEVFSSVIDTTYCKNAVKTAQGARLFLCESTYLEAEKELAIKHRHLTAATAAQIAKEAGAHQLILTHFSARYLDLSGFLEEARAIFPNTDVAEDFKVFDLPKLGSL